MKANNFQPAEHLEFNQVINHEGKLYLALELMVSKTISPESILHPLLNKDALIKAYQVRLDRCTERLQWAIAHNRIVAIEGADSSHVYYESSEKVAEACFKVQIGSYSLIAAQAMKDAIVELQQTSRSLISGEWMKEHLTSLQIQQLIKAFEELLTADREVLQQIMGTTLGTGPAYAEIRDYLDWLHEAYVISMEPNHMK